MADEISNQELVLQYTFDVTTADCDMNARLRPGGLINFLVLAAINSADSLGFGYAGLRGQQLFWVLSRMTIEIYKPLKWYDKAVVETWPKDVNGLLYLRDFVVKNQKEEIVAKCTSGWLAIDIQSKRPRKVEEKFSYIFDRMKELHALEQLPEKIGAIAAGDAFELKTTWFDLDVNKHVTSSRYMDWMVDTLPVDFLISHYPSKLSINYLKETMCGEAISLIQSTTHENQFLFEGVNRASDSIKFRGKMDF
ncbi:MAG: acyl-ACP thioesterase domain-containing protein [Bacteroidota bacterium]